ncbi:MAG: 3-phosphoshikimate 1-carboxyvinyltransferase [Bacilli bacterium]
MKVKINKSIACGILKAPPSKSYSHRYIIASLLSNNENIIHNISLSEDIKATLGCAKTFGADYKLNKDTLFLFPNKFEVSNPIFNCYESGSTLRFFIPIALLKYPQSTFIGSDKLLNRGIEVYKQIFENQDISIETYKDKIMVSGTLHGGEFYVPGNISSQYISGLLFTLPLLKEDSTIHIIPPIESFPYIEMTIDVLQKHNIQIQIENNILYIKGNQHYQNQECSIEGDYSNAAFLDVYNYLNGNVEVLNLNKDSLQGDKIYAKHFSTLKEKNAIIDISSCIDLGPVLFTFATLNNGARFIGTKRLKLKESNRIDDMVEELRKVNADIEVKDNEVIVRKSQLCEPDVAFDSHNDHRIVMALSMLCTLFTIEINGAEAVKKSYPNFFDDLRKIGIEVSEIA